MDNIQYINIINSDIRIIKGVGEKKAELLKKLGINTVWDLVYNFPRHYEDRSVFYTIANAPVQTNCCITGIIRGSVIEKRLKKNMSLYILRVEDSTGTINIKWFSSPFNKRNLKRGTRYSFYGMISASGSAKEMSLKEMEPAGDNILLGRIVPVYSLTSGITQKNLRTYVEYALSMITEFPETLPMSVINKYGLLPIDNSLRNIHLPENSNALKEARYRFAFEELFMLSLAMKKLRVVNKISSGAQVSDIRCAADFAKRLPFELTDDQKRTVNEIAIDLKSGLPMNRLVQGDVGSGKTAVAACGAYIMAYNGFQTAVMAPTEILANQHFLTFKEFFKDTDFKIGILTGSSSDKKDIKEKIKTGYYDIVIGTHALLEDNVIFSKLGLCITDEQHRFGVSQRSRLAETADHPHVLVMSATPIPRTLSLVLYGDLDISTIKTLPGGRKPTDTFCVNESMRSRVNNFIRKQVTEGFQCFVVCPLIDESDKLELKSGTEVYNSLKNEFPDLGIAFVHGKMSPTEKDSIMKDFKDGIYHILVSTTVIEVGIDIPNATLMIIENAERFGLYQLHQLRGRVGRGQNKSYCILISDTKTDDAKERMRIMCSSTDGFEIAQQDLKLRGCGEFFGTRQHGLPELKVANLFTDLEIAKTAGNACDELLKFDPYLSSAENTGLRLRIDRLFDTIGILSIFN